MRWISLLFVGVLAAGCGTEKSHKSQPPEPTPTLSPKPSETPEPSSSSEARKIGDKTKQCFKDLFAAAGTSSTKWLSVGAQLHYTCQASPQDLLWINQNLGEFHHE